MAATATYTEDVFGVETDFVAFRPDQAAVVVALISAFWDAVEAQCEGNSELFVFIWSGLKELFTSTSADKDSKLNLLERKDNFISNLRLRSPKKATMIDKVNVLAKSSVARASAWGQFWACLGESRSAINALEQVGLFTRTRRNKPKFSEHVQADFGTVFARALQFYNPSSKDAREDYGRSHSPVSVLEW